jgi:hypothetical protein
MALGEEGCELGGRASKSCQNNGIDGRLTGTCGGQVRTVAVADERNLGSVGSLACVGDKRVEHGSFYLELGVRESVNPGSGIY